MIAFRRLFLVVLTAQLCTSNAQNTLQEGFESWPPEEWTLETLGAGLGFIQDWQGESHSGNHSAYAAINNSNCDHWLISPAVELSGSNYEVSFWELNQDTQYYSSRSLWISTGSAEAGSSDFNLLWEAAELPETWTEQVVDLSDYSDQTITLAWRYQGTWHTWFVDDVSVAPSSFVDGSLVAWESPALFGSTLDPVEVSVVAKNWGSSPIEEASVVWQVNGVQQPEWIGTALNWESGEEITLNLGTWTPSESGFHDLVAELILPNDFDGSNNVISTTYDVSSEKDLNIVRAEPEGLQPIVDGQTVWIDVVNSGNVVVDTLEVEWSINGVAEPVWSATDANIAPGEQVRLNIGTISLAQGLYEFQFLPHALGDPLWTTKAVTTQVSVDLFHESFEAGTLGGLPRGWSSRYGIVEGTNFDLPHDGDWYYTAMPDANMFGTIYDTLWTPLLTLQPGDDFSFFIKKSDFLATTNQILVRDLAGNVSLLGNIVAPANNYTEISIDFPGLSGVYQVGMTSQVTDFPGLCRFDLFESTAKPFWPEMDLEMFPNIPHYAIPVGTPWTFDCEIKNTGLNFIPGSGYVVHLLRNNGGPAWDTLASFPGVDIAPWEQASIPLEYTWEDVAPQKLQMVIEGDNLSANNSSQITQVHVVPVESILTGGPPAESEILQTLNFPFNSIANSMTLGEDDLSQTLFRPEDLQFGGVLYGIAFHFSNVLDVLHNGELPLTLSVQPTSAEDLWELNPDPLAFEILAMDTLRVPFQSDGWMYVPFATPLNYSGLESLVFQFHQYNPGWPPSILRFFEVFSDEPDVIRTKTAQDVYQLDPLEPFDFGLYFNNYPDVRFILAPEEMVANLQGVVTDAVTGDPLVGAAVNVSGSSIQVETDADGMFALVDLPLGTYNLSIEKVGYASETWTGELETDGLSLQLQLEPLPIVSISGVVVADDEPTVGLAGVTLEWIGEGSFTTSTGADGTFSWSDAFGQSAYNLEGTKFGYTTGLWSNLITGSGPLNLDTLVLQRALLSPYDPVVNNAELRWKHPWTGRSTKRSKDTGVVSFSYTNEPNENVWLGNQFDLGSDTTTVLAIEITLDYYENAIDQVTVEILDSEGNVLTTSEPFLTLLDTTLVVPVAQIPLTGEVFAMLHWQNNPLSTNALCLDYSPEIAENAAAICYPGDAPMLLTDYFGQEDSNMAFHVRLLTWDDEAFNDQPPLAYQIKRGPSSSFPDVSDWDDVNPLNPSDTLFMDESASALDPESLYRYAVRAEYATGTSPWTFTVPWSPEPSDIAETESTQAPTIFPAAARVGTELSVANWPENQPLQIFDASGRCVLSYPSSHQRTSETQRISTSSMTPGVYRVLGSNPAGVAWSLPFLLVP